VATSLLCLLAFGCPRGNDSDLSFHRGTNALALGRGEWARRYFAEDLASHPDRLESLRGLGVGWISGSEGSLSHGIEALERYLEARPGDAEARLHLGRSRYRLRQLEPALAAVAGLPEGLEVHYLRSQILLELEPKRALPAVEAALAQDPDSSAAHLQAAKIHQALGNLERALEHGRRAAAIEPLREDVHILVANLERRLGRDEAAHRSIELHTLARQLPGRGRRSALSARQQVAVLRKILGLLNEPPASFQMRFAEALMSAGEWNEAEEWTERRLADTADSPAQLASLGRISQERGQPVLAYRIYEEVLRRQADHLGALTQLTLIGLELGNVEAARASLEKALAMAPDHGPFHFAASRLHLAARSEAEAETSLRRAVELLPWVALYRVSLADLLLARGDREAAVQLLAEAPAADPRIESYRRRLSG